jgi:aldehyde dehydrogenase (NAD+)
MLAGNSLSEGMWLDWTLGMLAWARDRGELLWNEKPEICIAVAAVAATYYLWRRLSKPAPPKWWKAADPSATIEKTKVVGHGKCELEDIPTLVSEMRHFWKAGYPLSYNMRIAQLKAAQRLLAENEEDLITAINKDLGRHRVEIGMYDTWLTMKECNNLISNLGHYMQPVQKGFSLMTYPSKQWMMKEPYGTVLVIGTWNYPLQLLLVPMLGAIAAGNNCILKSSVISRHTCELLGELIPKYMDPRVVSIIGPGYDRDRLCMEALLQERFDYVFFTGNPDIGKMVMRACADNLTPCSLELGGKNPVIVAEDADVWLAAKRTLWGRMMNAGQQCISPDYVLIDRKLLPKFEEACQYYIKRFYGSMKLGNIVSDRHMARLSGILDSHGGKVIAGGKYNTKERYIEPTVVLVKDVHSSLMKDETFGPILAVLPVDSLDEALDIVNSREKPLSLYIYTKSDATAHKITHQTSSGGVTVNAVVWHAGHPELPFGGVGHSGMGRGYHGEYTFLTFTHQKPVLVKDSPSWWNGALVDPFLIYPPWDGLREWVIYWLMRLG